MICDEGFQYNPNASACQATCSDPDAPDTCDKPNVEDCECIPGTILLGSKCVKPDQCGCKDLMGNRYPVSIFLAF